MNFNYIKINNFDKGLASKIYKDLLKVNNKQINNFVNLAKDQSRHFTKEDI